jgi:hypothetical protein
VSGDPGLFGRIRDRVDEASQDDAPRDDEPTAFSPTDLLALDDDERALVQLVLRSQPITPEAAAQVLGLEADAFGALLARVVERAAVEVTPDGIRVSTWRHRRRTPGGIWSRLSDL